MITSHLRPGAATAAAAACVLALGGCAHDQPEPMAKRDIHSFSHPEQVRVTHADISWELDFAARRLVGTVVWRLDRRDPEAPLLLDTRGLVVDGVRKGSRDRWSPTTYSVQGPEDPKFGSPLLVRLDPGDDRVEVRYRTTEASSGLQWLEPSQTAGGKTPFLFSQAQAIHARTFLPCQDSPGIRFTYTADVSVPKGMTAVMAARRLGAAAGGQTFRFEMPQAIPSYLVAVAAGDLAFHELGPRTGVWAEPSVVPKAAYEFADTEAMVRKAEELYGPYRWERYDLIVLPPSFPFGGMENPRLTFATPTVLAGDRSMVALVAHELAHSWSGNLVTNARWTDFWLNEGFTVYFERRIQEALYGRDRADMEAVLGKQGLIDEIKDLPPGDTILCVNLDGRDPDEAFSEVPYEKGYLLLRLIEETFGRDRFDPVLREWFDGNAFTSRTTEDFRAHLERRLLDGEPALGASLRLDEWLHAPGLPDNAPEPSSEALARASAAAAAFATGATEAAALPGKEWTAHEWIRFLRALPEDLPAERLAALDAAWRLTPHGNFEILCDWVQIGIRANYDGASPALVRILTTQGRRKFLKPVYAALIKTERGRAIANQIYAQARPLYHAIARNTIDEMLGHQP